MSINFGVKYLYIQLFNISNTLIETSSCDGLKIKEKVDFEVELTLTKCPEKLPSGGYKPIVFNISAQGIGERVVVNVDPMCECDCEQEALTVNLQFFCLN